MSADLAPDWSKLVDTLYVLVFTASAFEASSCVYAFDFRPGARLAFFPWILGVTRESFMLWCNLLRDAVPA